MNKNLEYQKMIQLNMTLVLIIAYFMLLELVMNYILKYVMNVKNYLLFLLISKKLLTQPLMMI
jgi:hypothetical protein